MEGLFTHIPLFLNNTVFLKWKESQLCLSCTRVSSWDDLVQALNWFALLVSKGALQCKTYQPIEEHLCDKTLSSSLG